MGLLDDSPLSEAELGAALLCEAVAEGAAAVTSRPLDGGSVVREDGTVPIAVIRPCMSRGRRVRELPPIYTPTMLREHAGVFTDWPMYRDHAVVVQESVREEEEHARGELAESLASLAGGQERLEEAVRKVGRSIDDLGGRIVRSWWDPAMEFEDDEEYGYQRGGVAAIARPLPAVRAMIEADPGLLHTSINAWPTGGKPGPAPWGRGQRGMIIEGIRRLPMGSVDWVVRGGAGGRVYVPRKVSLRESTYDPASGVHDMKLSEATTPAELRQYVQENAPQLLSVLVESGPAPVAGPASAAAPTSDNPITAAALQEALAAQQASITAAIAAEQTRLREESEAIAARDREAVSLREEAHRLIEAAAKSNGGFLTPKWVADLKASYTITAEGPSAGLLVEVENGEDPLAVLRENVQAQLDYAAELISESAGRPVVRAQGGGKAGGTEPGTGQRPPSQASWVGALDGMGMLEHDDKGAVKIDGLLESLKG
jgi:hypothetical protein